MCKYKRNDRSLYVSQFYIECDPYKCLINFFSMSSVLIYVKFVYISY